MDCSTPGFPVYHQLPEFTQTHVHWVGDAIQPKTTSTKEISPRCPFSAIPLVVNCPCWEQVRVHPARLPFILSLAGHAYLLRDPISSCQLRHKARRRTRLNTSPRFSLLSPSLILSFPLFLPPTPLLMPPLSCVRRILDREGPSSVFCLS